MRLWHKDLVSVLPKKQLIAQWRELCAIASSINKKGTPNHILVNVVIDYSYEEFIRYTKLVLNEMRIRGYKVSDSSLNKFKKNMKECKDKFNNDHKTESLYQGWHNARYFWQCYFNLQEKLDRGMFSSKEFEGIYEERCKKGMCHE